MRRETSFVVRYQRRTTLLPAIVASNPNFQVVSIKHVLRETTELTGQQPVGRTISGQLSRRIVSSGSVDPFTSSFDRALTRTREGKDQTADDTWKWGRLFSATDHDREIRYYTTKGLAQVSRSLWRRVNESKTLRAKIRWVNSILSTRSTLWIPCAKSPAATGTEMCLENSRLRARLIPGWL